MQLRMVTSANIKLLSVDDKLFAFAFAYLSGAECLCARAVAARDTCDWTDGAVVMFNACQAVELFLKAMLVKADRTSKIEKTHDIYKLAQKYEKTYTGPEHHWEIPFRKPPYPEQILDEDLRYMESRSAQPGIELRYPLSGDGHDWFSWQGFEPLGFSVVLKTMRQDFDRISNL